MEITEKVAYLKGLAEGMELDTEKKEGKLLSAIIDVLEDIALELEDIQDEQAELARRFGIMSIPTLVVMKGGKVVEQAVGARGKADIAAMLERHL